MAIQNFTRQQFAGALQTAIKGDWKEALDGKSGQFIYTLACAPVTVADAVVTFGLLVWSSIRGEGVSSAKAGEDSIRAIITKDGKPWGGKNKRWVARTPGNGVTTGWAIGTGAMVLSLQNQLAHLGRPCPSCGKALVPFTSTTEANPQRPFVKCMNMEGCRNPHFAWCEDENGKLVMPDCQQPVDSKPAVLKSEAPTPPAVKVEAPATPAPAATCDVPNCTHGHGPMIRMSSGKGWRCNVAGNRYSRNGWTVCDYVEWDKCRPQAQASATPVVTPAPAVKSTETEQQRNVRDSINLIREAARLLNVTDWTPKALTALSIAVGDNNLERLARLLTDATDPDFRCPQ